MDGLLVIHSVGGAAMLFRLPLLLCWWHTCGINAFKIERNQQSRRALVQTSIRPLGSKPPLFERLPRGKGRFRDWALPPPTVLIQVYASDERRS